MLSLTKKTPLFKKGQNTIANITSSNSTSFETYFAVNQETATAALEQLEITTVEGTIVTEETIVTTQEENLEGEKIMQKQTLIQEAVTPVQEETTNVVATPAPAKAHKSKVETIELEGEQIFALGNQQILEADLVSMCISARADANGKREMETKARELAEQGYDMIFSGVRPEDIWGINAALQHGARVVIFSHQGMYLLMHDKTMPQFKQAFQAGNVLFLSLSKGREDYSLERAQKRNDAVVSMCSGVYVPQALASQKIGKDGRKFWNGQGAWDLVARCNAAHKPVYVPCWSEEQPAEMAVMARIFEVIEVDDGQEISLDLTRRIRQAMEANEGDL